MSGSATNIDLLAWGNAGLRLQAVRGPNRDRVPDHDHGGSTMLTGQCMLVQRVGDGIHISPARPKEGNVSFELHAPGYTTVDAACRSGKMEHLKVLPA
jgi:hypothetical protein